MKVAKAAIGACLIFASTAAASAWPKPYAGEPKHTQDGVLVNFGNGNRAGGLTIRVANGKSQDYATSIGPDGTKWQHRLISCMWMPDPKNSSSACAEWPKQIVPGKTIVRVTYWVGTNNGPGIPGNERVATDVSVAR